MPMPSGKRSSAAWRLLRAVSRNLGDGVGDMIASSAWMGVSNLLYQPVACCMMSQPEIVAPVAAGDPVEHEQPGAARRWGFRCNTGTARQANKPDHTRRARRRLTALDARDDDHARCRLNR